MSVMTNRLARPSKNGTAGDEFTPHTAEELVQVFGNKVTMTKVEKHGWTMADRQGKFMLLPKSELNIDHAYQRDKINTTRVHAICSDWSWKACGVLSVSRRPDGTYWVFDGQHRKLAADKRADIKKLPCMVFDEGDDGRAGEACGFLAANTLRGPVNAWSNHKAAVFAGVRLNIAMQEMVEAEGLVVSSQSQPGTVACVAALLSQFGADEALCRRVFKACVRIAAGQPINDRFFVGMCGVERHLFANSMGSVSDGEQFARLAAAGYECIQRAIRRRVAELQQGGSKPWTDGIIQYVLNHGRRTRKIPSVY